MKTFRSYRFYFPFALVREMALQQGLRDRRPNFVDIRTMLREQCQKLADVPDQENGYLFIDGASGMIILLYILAD